MKRFIVLLLSVCAEIVYGSDYPALLEAITKYQDNASETNALQVIVATARSNDCEAVTARCMGIYTLHMGANGNATVCQNGLGALVNRYPDSDVTKQLRQLDLFPSPCPTCQGIGSLAGNNGFVCQTCKGTGKCPKCDGGGEFKYCPYHACRKMYTHKTLKGNWGKRYCPNCLKQGKSTELILKNCTDCSQTGKCPQCRGSGKQGDSTKFTRCPTCNGIPRKINTTVAQTALVKLCRDTKDTLQRGVDCEKAYAETLRIENPQARLEALNTCLTKYEGAFNLAMVQEARDILSKDVAKAEQLWAKEEKARLARERELAEQKVQTLKQHQLLMRTIRAATSKRAALLEIRKFIEENPESPVIVEARLLATEIEQTVAAENRAAKRIRNLVIGCVGAIMLAVVAWLVSCIKFTRPREVEIPVKFPKATPPQKIPFRPATQETAAAPRLRVLLPKQANTLEENAVACPECGAWLESPADVAEEDVVCASCHKAFHIQ